MFKGTYFNVSANQNDSQSSITVANRGRKMGLERLVRFNCAIVILGIASGAPGYEIALHDLGAPTRGY